MKANLNKQATIWNLELGTWNITRAVPAIDGAWKTILDILLYYPLYPVPRYQMSGDMFYPLG